VWLLRGGVSVFFARTRPPRAVLVPKLGLTTSSTAPSAPQLPELPDRYPLLRIEQAVDVRYLYCPGPDGKLIQAKYFGKVRDDIELAECTVSELKFKADDSEPTGS
jgi:hypothetical protein